MASIGTGRDAARTFAKPAPPSSFDINVKEAVLPDSAALRRNATDIKANALEPTSYKAQFEDFDL